MIHKRWIFAILIFALNIKLYAYDKNEIEKIVIYWNKACNDKSINAFNKMYVSNLLYYGKSTSKQFAIKDKQKLFNKAFSFNQYLASQIKITEYASGIIKCDFNKSVQVNNKKKKSYPSYLLLKEINNKLYIIGESDLLTDNKLNYTLDLGEEKVSSRNIYIIILLFILVVSLMVYLTITRKNRLSNIVVQPIQVIENGSSKSIENFKFSIPHLKGYKFEQFVVKLFASDKFILKEWRSDKIADNKSPESSKYPDLEFDLILREGACKFAVECKWRANADENNSIRWAEQYQIENYINYSKKFDIPVFVVIGIGGEPDQPVDVYSIPLEKLNYPVIYLNNYKNHKRYNPNRPFFLNLTLKKLD